MLARSTALLHVSIYARPRCVRCFATQKRRLDVAIVGAPNAGKSQLLNKLIQSNIAAVSRKRHTTRNGILSARTSHETQIVFVDTPGFLRPKNARLEGLTRDLTATAMAEVEHVDFTLLVVDAARKLTDNLKEALIPLMLKALKAQGRLEPGGQRVEPTSEEEKFAIVVNKVDLIKPKRNLVAISEELGSMAEECIKYSEFDGNDVDMDRLVKIFPPMFYTSALHDEGVADVWNYLMERATPTKEWILEKDQVTQLSPVERVEEVLREKIYRCLHREVPHQVQQVNRVFQFINDGDTGKLLRVDQDLVVRTKSHQKLVMGTGGKTLRRIQADAKRDLELMFECPVMLNLHVRRTKSKHTQQLEQSDATTRIEFRS